MRSKVIPLILLLLVSVPFVRADEKKDAKDVSVFDKKVEELAQGKTSREEKVIAVHAFVRDSITQVKTQYG